MFKLRNRQHEFSNTIFDDIELQRHPSLNPLRTEPSKPNPREYSNVTLQSIPTAIFRTDPNLLGEGSTEGSVPIVQQENYPPE